MSPDIDEFTETTSQAIVEVGGAMRGKAIIVLNPAEPSSSETPPVGNGTLWRLRGELGQDQIGLLGLCRRAQWRRLQEHAYHQ